MKKFHKISSVAEELIGSQWLLNDREFVLTRGESHDPKRLAVSTWTY